MNLISRKIAAFAKKVANLSPKPGGTMPVAELQAQFDAAPEELRAALNGAIDDIIADYALKAELNGLVLGQVPDGSLTEPKFTTALAQKLNDGYNAINAMSFLSRQAIINGNFDVWQRGTSFSAAGYGPDRWRFDLSGSTASRQSSGAPIGSQYFARVTMNSASTFGNAYYVLESKTVQKLVGKRQSLKIKLRRNASFTAGLTVSLQKGTAADTLLGGTWTDLTSVTISTASIPTGTTAGDWFTVKLPADIPNDGSVQGLRIQIVMTVGQNAGAYYEIAQAYLHEGDKEIPFQARSYEEEFRECRRFCQVITDPINSNFVVGAAHIGNSSLSADVFIPISPMRVTPTLVATVGDWQLHTGTSAIALSALSTATGLSSNHWVVLTATPPSSLSSSGVVFSLRSTSAGKLLILDSEL